jgi:hypothetical protein
MQLRVSSIISNGKVILNVDCDMYSNNSESIRDALCFFMDEEKGHEIAFVQSPQTFENVTKNDLYASALLAISEVSSFLYQVHDKSSSHSSNGCVGMLEKSLRRRSKVEIPTNNILLLLIFSYKKFHDNISCNVQVYIGT